MVRPGPLVSVIIPTYNRARLLSRAVRSALGQAYPHVEIIVVDDASTDETQLEIERLNSPRVRYCRNSRNSGAQASRNVGIGLASGEYINFLDSDDELLPEKIELQLRAFAGAAPGVGVVYSYLRVLNDHEGGEPDSVRYPYEGNIYPKLLAAPSVDFITPLIKRECLEKIGPLDEKVAAYQEWDTLMRISAGYEFLCLPVELAVYHRQSGGNISNSVRKEAEGYTYIVEKHKREIHAVCGRRPLGQHYLKSAQFYFACRDSGRAVRQAARALYYDPSLPIYRAYARMVKVFPFLREVKGMVRRGKV